MKSSRATMQWALVGGSLMSMLLGCSQDVGGSDDASTNSAGIIGGQLESGYPAAGYLTETGDKSFCGGTLVDDVVVVTAAHCVADRLGGFFSFGVGKVVEHKTVPVGSVHVHPNYDPNHRENDIAALILARPPFSVLDSITPATIVNPANLDTCAFRDIGYGRVTEGGTKPSGYAGIRKSIDLCFDTRTGPLLIGHAQPGGTVCHGDSGSGVFVKGTNHYVGAIVSIGTQNCTDLNQLVEAVSAVDHEQWLDGIISSSYVFGTRKPGGTGGSGPGTCTSQCSSGDKRCVNGDQFQTCADYNGDGCTEWGNTLSCSVSFPGTTCSAGYCVGPAPCTDQCSNGSKQCVNGDQFQTCADYNGDGCTEWGNTLSCSVSFPGTTCSAGYCVGPDPGSSSGSGGGCNQCSSGDKQCIDGDQFQTCADYNGDGCTEWGNTISCSASYPGTSCSGGYCVGSDPGPSSGCDQCANGSKQCIDGDAYQDCGDFDGNGCTEWSGAYSCSASWPGTVCQDGWCVYP